MTVGVDDELRIREYPGDDSATPRAYGFKILDPDDLRVTRTNADGTETVLVRGTHYSVSGAGNPTGGNVTPLAPISAGTSWRIEGDMGLGQPTDYTGGDDFPAESHERGLDRAMIAHQEARRDISDTQARSVMVPRGEMAGPLPPLEQLLGKFLSRDADGNWIGLDGTGADAALRGQLANALLGGAGLLGFLQGAVDAQNRSVMGWMQERAVSINDFGGTTVQRMKKAAALLQLRGGGTMLVPRGSYELASAELAAPISLSAGVQVDLDGSTLTVTGANIIGSVFEAENVSNVTIRNGEVFGNGQANGYNNGAFFNATLTADGTADMRNIRVEDLYLENFKAPWWIHIRCGAAAYRVSGVRIRRITGQSVAGNAIGPTGLNWNAAVICVAGNENYVVENVEISGIWVDATHIKTGIIIFHGVVGTTIDNVTILNAGFSGSFGNDAGCYALMIYDTWRLGSTITVRNFVLSGRSCGIYVAGFKNLTFENGTITGQFDPADGTLPKGAIAMNGPRNITLRSIRIADCLKGVQLTGPEVERADALLEKVFADDNVNEPLQIKPFTGFDMNGVKITQSRFVATGVNRAADFRVGTDKALNELVCEDSHFEAPYYAFDARALDQAHVSSDWTFRDCRAICDAAIAAIKIREMSGKLRLRDVFASTTGSGQAIQLDDSTDIELHNVTAVSSSGGVGFSLESSRGAITGDTVSIDATTPVLGLGAAKPTHAGRKGQFVKAINYTVANAGNGQTQIIGWRCEGGATWRPVLETVNAA